MIDAVDRYVEQRRLVDAQKYQMMDLAVQPAHQDPIIVLENHRLQQQQQLLLLLPLACHCILFLLFVGSF